MDKYMAFEILIIALYAVYKALNIIGHYVEERRVNRSIDMIKEN